jgi:hypothetical protein
MLKIILKNKKYYFNIFSNKIQFEQLSQHSVLLQEAESKHGSRLGF